MVKSKLLEPDPSAVAERLLDSEMMKIKQKQNKDF